MPRKEPEDFKAKLAKHASLAERTILLCLNGKLRGEHDELELELASMTNNGSSRLGGNPHAADLARRMVALREEMVDSEQLFRLRALNTLRYREILAEHPPRKGNAGDESLGWNQATFYRALARESIVEPEIDDDSFDLLLSRLNPKQADELEAAAFMVSMGTVNVPFSALASETLRNSGETSKPQPDLESLLAGSGDGNPNTAPVTATAQPAG